MQQVKYKFYATLLDGFEYYLSKVDDDSAYDSFIDKLNRKPFVSDAATKGTAFNDFVDKLNAGLINDLRPDGNGNFRYEHREGDVVNTYLFKESVVNDITNRVKGYIPQVFVSAPLETKYGFVELYGFADEVRFDRCIDIKTTSRYTFPKYLKGWQSKVYPYCFNKVGVEINVFEYLITDFSNVYIEEYAWNPERDTQELRLFCERLIDFIEINRDRITSTDPKVLKLFALDEEAR